MGQVSNPGASDLPSRSNAARAASNLRQQLTRIPPIAASTASSHPWLDLNEFACTPRPHRFHSLAVSLNWRVLSQLQSQGLRPSSPGLLIFGC